MTRKCVLCKETNYKNTYSFFSAPKDPETRKKWERAIGIRNYAVTDDTYVCSKHFRKSDIITHWVSGVPPHVITIKYKKCRLRPGAVPGRSRFSEEDSPVASHEESEDCETSMTDCSTFKVEESMEKEKPFLIPRTGQPSAKREEVDKNMLTASRISSRYENRDHLRRGKSTIDGAQFMVEKAFHGSLTSTEQVDKGLKKYIGSNKNGSPEEAVAEASAATSPANVTTGMMTTTVTTTVKMEHLESKGQKADVRCRQDDRGTGSSLPREAASPGSLDTKYGTEKTDARHRKGDRACAYYGQQCAEGGLGSSGCIEVEPCPSDESSHIHGVLQDYAKYEFEENEMLFEDLLETCTEIILPRGWSCLVTSKGHATTITYVYMKTTTSGMPFVEKQVFLKSDMRLRCAVVNREISPVLHNLLREGKNVKVRTLLDVEELVDEFDQRTVCQGIYNGESPAELRATSVAYLDGVRWRHASCSLIVNNDSPRCTKCIGLSRTLRRKARKSPSRRYNELVALLNEQQRRRHTLRQIRKRTRGRDRRYEFLTLFRK